MKFLVKEKDDGKRLDIFLSEKINHLTRSNIKKIIESRNVKINRKITNSSAKKVKLKNTITIEYLIKESPKLLPNKIELDIRFEDKILKGKDLFNRNINYKPIEVDQSFPIYIYNNKDRFKNWII